uniref:GRB2 associated binding protein 3 n=3 Tax=Suricata suricatta TaxID=37032 RepID=A0A673U0F8_SURSU
AWRRRWFVLRRGRMSGSPDVLEYYRTKHSSKPIRVIDLSECAVCQHVGPGCVRKEFQNDFVFTVKTASRTFYLVAKTEVEMLAWVYSISQVCNFGQLEDSAADSMESSSSMASPPQPAPASVGSSLLRDSPSTNVVATEESGSESELLSLPDYLILSNCETGRPRHTSLPTRCDSWSNSDRSLEQTSFDDVFVDCLQPVSPSNLVHPSHHGNGSQKVPSTKPQAALIWNRDISGPTKDPFYSPLVETSLNSTIQVDKNQGSLPCVVKELDIVSNMPPPRPPKPSHLSERRQEERVLWNEHGGIKKPECTTAAAARRISLSGLDNMTAWKADAQGQPLRHRDKRLSLNLPCGFSAPPPTAAALAEAGYVPMGPLAAPSALRTRRGHEDYVPMGPRGAPSPLPVLSADTEPPPVNRDLKPQRKPRPAPLDLSHLSTIREHASLTRNRTVLCNRTRLLSPERNGINSARFCANSVSRQEEQSYIHTNRRTANSLSTGALTWTENFSLDYLALDFNSTSPAPVQQKLLLSEEQRVDYVQVDEQKTQALQSTKQEWTDERQSKA